MSSAAARVVSTHLPPTKFAPHLPTAVEIVQSLLARHGPMRTQQIFREGLAQYPSETVLNPPPPPEKVVRLPDGSVKMRFAANVRGNQTPWQPMPTPGHPDHPFLSMANLKGTVLAQLESLNLIQKVPVETPLVEPSDIAEAHSVALKLTRRRQREKAKEIGWGIGFRLAKQAKRDWENAVYALEVEKVEPKMTKTVWVWVPTTKEGGEVEMTVEERQRIAEEYTKSVQAPNQPSDVASTSKENAQAPSSTLFRSILDDPAVKRRWEMARNAELKRREIIDRKTIEIQQRRERGEASRQAAELENQARQEEDRRRGIVPPKPLTEQERLEMLRSAAAKRFAALKAEAAQAKEKFWSMSPKQGGPKRNELLDYLGEEDEPVERDRRASRAGDYGYNRRESDSNGRKARGGSSSPRSGGFGLKPRDVDRQPRL